MLNPIRLLLLTFAFALAAIGQTFSSGSTGADGALDLTAGDRTVQLPDSGILNYTTVNIPSGTTLRFGLNLRNTPVVMLAQGAVTISGMIDIMGGGLPSRTRSEPGPGGFYGGNGEDAHPSVGRGFGPGGGSGGSNGNGDSCGGGFGSPGQWIGPLSLVPNIGGSGGGGTTACYLALIGCSGGNTNGPNGPGGGGGGAITLASSSNITVGGRILAYGANIGGGCGIAPGANGAIRLVSNSITVTGELEAAVVRIEAPAGARSYTGSGTAPVLSTVNPQIVPVNPPVLNIVSIGGYPVPSYSGSSFSTIDVLLPTQLQDPLPVVVQATNVPPGSAVTVVYTGSRAGYAANLTGTNASSTATVYVSGVGRTGITYLFASVTFDASLIASNLDKINPTGLSKIELAAAPGQRTKYRFLRDDGSEIAAATIPEDIRRLFGL